MAKAYIEPAYVPLEETDFFKLFFNRMEIQSKIKEKQRQIKALNKEIDQLRKELE